MFPTQKVLKLKTKKINIKVLCPRDLLELYSTVSGTCIYKYVLFTCYMLYNNSSDLFFLLFVINTGPVLPWCATIFAWSIIFTQYALQLMLCDLSGISGMFNMWLNNLWRHWQYCTHYFILYSMLKVNTK